MGAQLEKDPHGSLNGTERVSMGAHRNGKGQHGKRRHESSQARNESPRGLIGKGRVNGAYRCRSYSRCRTGSVPIGRICIWSQKRGKTVTGSFIHIG